MIVASLGFHTFLNVSISNGLPFGNDIQLGHSWLILLITKQIAADTTHWNQVTNNGASKLTVSLLSNALFTNTVTIDVILESGENKIFVKPVCRKGYVSELNPYQYAATTKKIRMYFDTKFSGSSLEYIFLWTCCTGNIEFINSKLFDHFIVGNVFINNLALIIFVLFIG